MDDKQFAARTDRIMEIIDLLLGPVEGRKYRDLRAVILTGLIAAHAAGVAASSERIKTILRGDHIH